MKFRIETRASNRLRDDIRDLLDAMDIFVPDGMADTEKETYRADEKQRLCALCGQWFWDNQILTVEIDDDAQTCRVVRVGEGQNDD